MKDLFIILIAAITIFSSCREKEDLPANLPKNFVNEISYTISRTGTSEEQEVKAADIMAAYHHNVYPVLNNPGERDILLQIYPETPASISVVSRFAFEFIMSVPEDLFLVPDTNVLTTATLVNPEDYTQLLLDDDEENGRRVCLTKEGQHPDGSILIDNACASEGWYGEDGDFEFEFTYHELFYDVENQPNIYVEGTFEAETGTIGGSDEKFKLSNGSFKLVIPLRLE